MVAPKNSRQCTMVLGLAAALIFALSPAKAQQLCDVEGVGSPDPNKVLQWKLTTHAGTTCTYSIVPPDNWINLNRHVVTPPAHGKAGFSDSTHLAYRPAPGFTGGDSFVIEIDRKIRETGERIRRVIAFEVTVLP